MEVPISSCLQAPKLGAETELRDSQGRRAFEIATEPWFA